MTADISGKVIVYTVKDIPDVVAGKYGQPFGSLCLQVLGPNAGLAMFSLNIIAQFFVGQGCTIAATRVIFAYSRDGYVRCVYCLPVLLVWVRATDLGVVQFLDRDGGVKLTSEQRHRFLRLGVFLRSLRYLAYLCSEVL